MEKNVKLAVVFLRHQYLPHLALTLLLCILSGYVVSFQNLDVSQSARVLEMYVIFVGMLLLTPLFMPEQDREIWQLEQTKKTSMYQLYVERILIAVCLIGIIAFIFLIILQESNSAVIFGKMFLGVVSEMIFFGAIGFGVSGITNQVVLGYMAPVMYYAVNIGKADSFGKFALFQMMKGQYDFSGAMLVAAGGLLVSGVVIREVRSRR